MRNIGVHTALTVAAALCAVVAFLAIDAAALRAPATADAGYVADPVLGFDAPNRDIPAQADVLAVGCSQTYGWGVRRNQAFPALVGAHNLALPSYGGAGSLAMLERHAHRKPRVVIYGLWAEHRTRNVTPCVETPTPLCVQRPTVERDGAGYRLQSPRSIDGVADTRQWLELARGSYLERMQASWLALVDRVKRPDVSAADPAGAEAFVLRRMAAVTRAMGAKLVVVYLPDYTRGWPATPPEYVELAQREGFTFIDAAAALRPLGARVSIPGDGHMSAEAHAAVAALIAEGL